MSEPELLNVGMAHSVDATGSSRRRAPGSPGRESRASLIERSGQRIRLGYNEPVDDIPPVLVHAIAAVTRTGVDIVYPGTVSIASFVQHVKSRPAKSIEQLLIEHDI